MLEITIRSARSDPGEEFVQMQEILRRIATEFDDGKADTPLTKLVAFDESLPRVIEANEIRPGDVFMPTSEACRYVAGNVEVSTEAMRVPLVSVETVSFERPIVIGGPGKTVWILQHSRVILFYRKEPNDET